MDPVEKLEKKVDRMADVMVERMKPVITSEIQGLELRLATTYGERMTKFEVRQAESKERISGIDLKCEKLDEDSKENSKGLGVVQALCTRNHKDSVPPRTKTNPKIPQNVVKVGVPVTAITALITWLISKFS